MSFKNIFSWHLQNNVRLCFCFSGRQNLEGRRHTLRLGLQSNCKNKHGFLALFSSGLLRPGYELELVCMAGSLITFEGKSVYTCSKWPRLEARWKAGCWGETWCIDLGINAYTWWTVSPQRQLVFPPSMLVVVYSHREAAPFEHVQCALSRILKIQRHLLSPFPPGLAI